MDKKAEEQEPPKFLRVTEVASLLECSESHAYKIIQKLNKELESKGAITVAGRISRRYLMERLYC